MSTAKKKIIPIEVRDEYILGSGVSIGARGSYDSVVLRTKFDDSWIGLNKYATWTNALGEVGDQTIITALDLVDGEVDTYDIPVPAFATEEAGTIKVSFTGYVIGAGDNTVDSLANTVSGAFRVLDSNATKLDGGNTAATVADQLVAAMDTVTEKMLEVEGLMDDFTLDMNRINGSEETRVATEIERQGAEQAREAAETERANAEAVRAYAERIRARDEEIRADNEIRRGSVFGDLEAAVDAIIEIQNSLMGGDGV